MGRFDLKAREWLATPERKRIYNELHFSEAASRYDAATRAMSLFRDASWKARLVDSLPDLPAPFCVDLACGTGDVSFLLARRYPAGSVVGVDIAESLVAFPGRAELREIFSARGFSPVFSERFFLGMLKLLVLRRKPR